MRGSPRHDRVTRTHYLPSTTQRRRTCTQRVSRAWDVTISSSPKLQKALYFGPFNNIVEDTSSNTGRHLLPSIKPFRAVLMKLGVKDGTADETKHTPEDPIRRSARDFYADCITESRAVCNPFLQHFCRPIKNKSAYCFRYDSAAAVFLKWSEHTSWETMYLTQPPTTRIKVRCSTDVRRDPVFARPTGASDEKDRKFVIERRSGVRLGDLIERVDEKCEVDGQRVCTFTIEI